MNESMMLGPSTEDDEFSVIADSSETFSFCKDKSLLIAMTASQESPDIHHLIQVIVKENHELAEKLKRHFSVLRLWRERAHRADSYYRNTIVKKNMEVEDRTCLVKSLEKTIQELEQQVSSLSSENSKLKSDNDMLKSENDALKPGKDALKGGSNSDDDALKSGENALNSGEDALNSGEDALKSDEDALKSGEDALKSGEYALKSDKNYSNSDEDAIKSGEAVLKSGEDALKPGEDALKPGEDALKSGDNALKSDKDASKSVKDTIKSDEDALKSCNMLKYEKYQQNRMQIISLEEPLQYFPPNIADNLFEQVYQWQSHIDQQEQANMEKIECIKKQLADSEKETTDIKLLADKYKKYSKSEKTKRYRSNDFLNIFQSEMRKLTEDISPKSEPAEHQSSRRENFRQTATSTQSDTMFSCI